MERKVLILNGSPRAPKSNSKRYAALFSAYCPLACDTLAITPRNHAELAARLPHYSDLLLVFPLYADALPVGVLDFLQYLEAHPVGDRPTVSVLINCGFLEPSQNEIAVRMVRLFCRRNGYRMGSVLMLGSGEAILDTPFRYVARRKIRQLAWSVAGGTCRELRGTMPLAKRLFLLASTWYWTSYGRKFGVSKRQMQTLQIEQSGLPDSETAGMH